MDSCLSSPATLPILNHSISPLGQPQLFPLESLGNFSKTTLAVARRRSRRRSSKRSSSRRRSHSCHTTNLRQLRRVLYYISRVNIALSIGPTRWRSTATATATATGDWSQRATQQGEEIRRSPLQAAGRSSWQKVAALYHQQVDSNWELQLGLDIELVLQAEKRPCVDLGWDSTWNLGPARTVAEILNPNSLQLQRRLQLICCGLCASDRPIPNQRF